MECTPVIKLDILICTMYGREGSYEFIRSKLQDQILKLNKVTDVSILTEIDDGSMAIGQKRNKLLFRAKGEYVCFVDDDDDVSDDYIESILKAIETKPDCVGIEGILFYKDKKAKFFHSIEFQDWYTGFDGYYRTPNHLNPIKREIVMKIMFPEINFGEDQKFSDTIKKLLKTEIYIDHPIYFYMMSGEKYELSID